MVVSHLAGGIYYTEQRQCTRSEITINSGDWHPEGEKFDKQKQNCIVKRAYFKSLKVHKRNLE